MTNLCQDRSGTEDGALFSNDAWDVVADGLEHRETGYFIARDALARRRGDLWEWPLHLAEKRWCRPRLFREAFLAALERFGIARDEALSRSFALGFGIRAGSDVAVRDGAVALADLVRPRPIERERPAREDAAGRRQVFQKRLMLARA